MFVEKETYGNELNAATQGDWKWNSGFEKKEELEANSIYRFNQLKIWNWEAPNPQKISISVSQIFKLCHLFGQKDIQRVFGNVI